MKKIVFVLGLVMALSLVSTAGAATVAEQIAALQTQLNALLATQGGTATTVAGAYAADITKDLTVGSKGDEVVALQSMLEDGAYLEMPAGVDKGTFGPLTKKAVIAWQKDNDVSPAAGYFGKKSLAKLVELEAAAPAVVPGTTLPAGCTSAQGFSPTTGANCATGVTTTTTGVPSEGTFVPRIAATPSNSTNLSAGSDKAVYGIEIEAKDSDMSIDRADLEMAVTKSSTAINPSNFIKTIKMYDGETLLTSKAVTAADFEKDSATSHYYVRVTGIGFKVPKGVRKVLTVKVDTATGLDTTRGLVINVFGDGLRGVDTLGFQSYEALSDTRTFTFKTGGDSTLTATTAATNPAAASVAVDDDNGVENVPMLVVNAKSTVGDSTITDVAIFVSASVATSSPSSLDLYADGVKIDSRTAAHNATTTFSDLSIAVAKDVTKVLTIKANFPALARGTATTTLDVSYSFYETPDSSATAFAGSDITSQIVTLQAKVADISLASISDTKITENSVTGTSTSMSSIMKINLKGVGGDLVEPVIGDFVMKAATNTSTFANAITITNMGFSVSPNNTNNLIADGVNAVVTLTPTLTNAQLTGVNLQDGMYFFYLESISSAINGLSAVSKTTGLEDFQTVPLFFDK
ncbi:MAG: peptidoglycan-binding protein [Candidatus Vogelbacteria bacterium]|nr:peptidoglycan-binding protein [Candidatus Vogelbacteria bacterium]